MPRRTTKYKQHGEGLVGDLVDKIAPTRKQFPPKVRNILAKYKDEKVIGIEVGRNPVQSYATKILNWISQGKFEEQLKKMNYDDVYHLFMIVKLANGKSLLIEKNSVVNIQEVSPNYIDKASSKINVPITKSITFGDMIKNAVNQVGESIYLYDHVNNNCQVFVRNILKANGLLTPQIESFIMQDVEQLLSTSPEYTNAITRFVTEADAKLNRVIHGEGMQRGRGYTPKMYQIQLSTDRRLINI